MPRNGYLAMDTEMAPFSASLGDKYRGTEMLLEALMNNKITSEQAVRMMFPKKKRRRKK